LKEFTIWASLSGGLLLAFAMIPSRPDISAPLEDQPGCIAGLVENGPNAYVVDILKGNTITRLSTSDLDSYRTQYPTCP
jgi:hypothetical protein